MLLEPECTQHVSHAIQAATTLGIPWIVLGLGSNILAPDEGFDGMVIRFGKRMADVTQEQADPALWTLGAGLPTPVLAKRTAARGFGGVHRLIGVPGTVGGAVFMNAGAHGQEFAAVVKWVEVVESDGSESRLFAEKIPWQYRSSGLNSVVVAAQVSLTPEDPAILKRDVARHLRWRKAGTPFDQPCCGSVFRNPTVDPHAPGIEAISEPRTAGKFIDAAGLKGFRVGGAQVSPMHANYIVNTGAATAADVRAVIDGVRERVLERFGFELQLEVKLIGPR